MHTNNFALFGMFWHFSGAGLRILGFPHCEVIINEQLEKEWADRISDVDTTEFNEQMVANLQSTMSTLQTLAGAQHAGGSSVDATV